MKLKKDIIERHNAAGLEVHQLKLSTLSNEIEDAEEYDLIARVVEKE